MSRLLPVEYCCHDTVPADWTTSKTKENKQREQKQTDNNLKIWETNNNRRLTIYPLCLYIQIPFQLSKAFEDMRTVSIFRFRKFHLQGWQLLVFLVYLFKYQVFAANLSENSE